VHEDRRITNGTAAAGTPLPSRYHRPKGSRTVSRGQRGQPEEDDLITAALGQGIPAGVQTGGAQDQRQAARLTRESGSQLGEAFREGRDHGLHVLGRQRPMLDTRNA
jgi:hypothetical protein